MTKSNVTVEQEIRALGIERYWARIKKAKERHRESETYSGRYLLREATQKLEEAVAEWVSSVATRKMAGPRHSAADWLSKLDPGIVAVITAKTVLDNISL